MATSLRDREVYRCIGCGETVPASRLNQHCHTCYACGDGPPGFEVLLSAEQVAAADDTAADVGDDTISGA